MFIYYQQKGIIKIFNEIELNFTVKNKEFNTLAICFDTNFKMQNQMINILADYNSQIFLVFKIRYLQRLIDICDLQQSVNQLIRRVYKLINTFYSTLFFQNISSFVKDKTIMSLLKTLQSKSSQRLVIYQDKNQKDTPIQQLFQNNPQVLIEYVWLSSESYHEVMTGIEFPDKKDNQVLTKSPFVRSLEKLETMPQNQYGVIVLENAQILSGPQRDELGIFLLDLQEGFLQINGKKLKIPQRSLILIRVHDSFSIQSWKLSRSAINCKKRDSEPKKIIKNDALNQVDNMDFKVYQNKNILYFKVINKNTGEQTNIPLSKDLHEEIKKENNLLSSQMEKNVKQLKQRIQNLQKIKLYLRKSLLYSITQMQIDKDSFKHKYPTGIIEDLAKFIFDHILGQNFREVGFEDQKKLKNKLQPVWNTYSLDRVSLQELQNTISNGKTAAEMLSTQFLQFINVKQMEEATQILIEKFNSQTNDINIQLKIIKSSIEKFFYRNGLIPTTQSLKILSKCHQVIQNNQLFLVLIGPTGVGKTHVPKMYSFLTKCQKKGDKLQVSGNKYASVAFHRGKDESEFHGNFTVDKDGKLSYFYDTTFKKVVQKGGVILLSQLNTVVKNREAILAWWLKQIQNTKPQPNGDRVIKLQSVPTHNPQLYEIRIKKGTLIVVDINTKDYLGRTSIPDHFASKNRLQIKALVTCTTDQKLIKKQIQILSKYIELFWDQQIMQLSIGQLSQLKKKQWQHQRNQRQDKYNKYAKILRDIAIAYEEGKYGKLSQQEINQGKHNKWKFSIRQVRRIIEDIQKIKKENLHIEDFQCLYEHLGLRWKHQQDRLKVKEILSYSLERQNTDIKIDPKSFLTKNMLQNRRAIMWVQSPSQQSAYKEILKLQLEFQPQNIHCYKMSHQVGQFQLLGGQVPCKNQKDENNKVSLGVLTNWLQKYQNSQQKLLLILQNVDKMDAGSISMLNNFLQDYQNEKLYFNGNQYKIPKNGMILMVTREQVSWSAAQNSRVVYFRYFDKKCDLILQSAQKHLFSLNDGQLLNIGEKIAPFNSYTLNNKQSLLFNPIKCIPECLNAELKNDNILQYLNSHENLMIFIKNIHVFISFQIHNFINKAKQRKQIQESIERINKQMQQPSQSKERLKTIKDRLNSLELDREKIQVQIKSMKRCLQNPGITQDEITLMENLIQEKKNNKKKLQQKQQDCQKQIKKISAQIKPKKEISSQSQQALKYLPQKLKTIISQIHTVISLFENNLKFQVKKTLKNVKQIESNYQKLIKYQLENGKVYLNYNDRKYETNFTEIPSVEKINEIKSKMQLTPQLALVLQLSLVAFQQNRTVYLQGKAGVGKTKLTEFMAKLLNFNCSGNPFENNYFVFQMSANVQLSDLIGGFDIKYQNNKRVITINRSTQLIKLIQQGGIFVLDEAAVSKQAKKVISWFSEIAQKRPGDKIILQDIPGHFTEITIHKHFHLIITGNDPKTTINRKQLPLQVLDFAYKIIYPQTKQKQDIIKITKKMMANQIKIVNQNLAAQIGNFHFDISQKNKKSTTQRDILKLIKLLNKKLENINTQSIQYRKAIYFTYFAKYSQVQQYQFKFDNKFKRYITNNQDIASNIENFNEQLQMMSSNRIPLLINYEPLSKVQLIKNIKSKYPNIHIFKSMTSYTEQNLLGGFASNEKGEMCFKMAGFGRFLVDNQGLIDQSPPVQILICDIQLINEGVRTQLNQFLQDGYVYINNVKYYWPINLRLIFTVPIEKIDCLSEPYQSRHLQIKYKPNNLKISTSSIEKQAQYIDEELKPSQKLKVLNLFGEKTQKQETLNLYRRNNKDKYFKLVVSQEIQEVDWMGSLTKENNKFGTKVLGLYKYLQVENSVIEIVGLENNHLLLNVIESLLIADWVNNNFLETMIPGLNQFKIFPVTIILNTKLKANKIMPLMNEWQGVKYFQITQNRTVSISKIQESVLRQMKESQIFKSYKLSLHENHQINYQDNFNNLKGQLIQKRDERDTEISQNFKNDSYDNNFGQGNVSGKDLKLIKGHSKQSRPKQGNNKQKAEINVIFFQNITQTFQLNCKKNSKNQPNEGSKNIQQRQLIKQPINEQSNDKSTLQSMGIINRIQNKQSQERQIPQNLIKKKQKNNIQKQQPKEQQEEDKNNKINLIDLFKAIINLKLDSENNRQADSDQFWVDSYWQNQGYIISVKRGQYQLNQFVTDLSNGRCKILRPNTITKIKLSMKKQHVHEDQRQKQQKEQKKQQKEQKKQQKEQKKQQKQKQNVNNAQLNHFNKLIICLKSIKNLQTLDLDFSQCENLQDNHIFFVKETLQKLQNLSHFTLNLAGCNKLTNQAIRFLIILIEQKNLKTFSINLCGTNLDQKHFLQVEKVIQKLTSFYGSCTFSSQQINQFRQNQFIQLYGLQLMITKTQTQQTIKSVLTKSALKIIGLSSLRINFSSSKIQITQSLLLSIFDIIKNKFKSLENFSFIFEKNQSNPNLQDLLKSLIPEQTLYDERKLFLYYMTQILWNNYKNEYLYQQMKNAQAKSKQKHIQNILGRKSLRNLANNQIELLLDFDEWHSLTVTDGNNKNLFEIKQFLQMKKSLIGEINKNGGYLQILVELYENYQLIKLSDAQYFFDKFIESFQQSRSKTSNKKFQWNENEAVIFLRMLDQSSQQFSYQNCWRLQSSIDSFKNYFGIYYQQEDSSSSQKSQRMDIYQQSVDEQETIIEKIYKKLQNIYLHAFKLFKVKSFMPKSHWLNYISGQTKQKVVSKSGKFSFHRFIQNKKPFYYRHGKTQGDIEMSKKFQKDYDDFMEAKTDQQIESLLNSNPKLIYCFKHEILALLISEENKRVLRCVKQTQQLNKRLPSDIQSIIEDVLRRK